MKQAQRQLRILNDELISRVKIVTLLAIKGDEDLRFTLDPKR